MRTCQDRLLAYAHVYLNQCASHTRKCVPAAGQFGRCKLQTARTKTEVPQHMQATAGRELKWWHVFMAHPGGVWRKCGPLVSLYDSQACPFTFRTRDAFLGTCTSLGAQVCDEYKANMSRHP